MGLSPQQIAGAAKQAGFAGNNLTISVAVALAESGGNPTATNSNSNGSTDYGLWQINSVHADLLRGKDWTNPVVNAQMAKAVFDGSGWRAWTTYTSGAYLRFMGQAAAGAGNPDSSLPGGGGIDPNAQGDPQLESISTFVNLISDPHTWFRVGWFVGGIIIAGIGVTMVVKKTRVGHAAMKVAEVAAVV